MKKQLILSVLLVFSVAMFAPSIVSAVNSNNTVELPVNDNDKKEKKSKKKTKKAKKSDAKECSGEKKSTCCGK